MLGLLLTVMRSLWICDCVIQVLNLYANDGQRLFQGVTWAAHVTSGPLVVIGGMACAISLIGLWALIGFAIILLMIPLQVRTMRIYREINKHVVL